jgi:hypothetical protein
MIKSKTANDCASWKEVLVLADEVEELDPGFSKAPKEVTLAIKLARACKQLQDSNRQRNWAILALTVVAIITSGLAIGAAFLSSENQKLHTENDQLKALVETPSSEACIIDVPTFTLIELDGDREIKNGESLSLSGPSHLRPVPLVSGDCGEMHYRWWFDSELASYDVDQIPLNPPQLTETRVIKVEILPHAEDAVEAQITLENLE